jgi:hypothetical protein
MSTVLDYSKAIETAYNGILFRSRTEARIALFLDLMGIEWSYEPEGFDVNGQWYLPDFYLPLYDAFWEVKAFDSQLDKKTRDLLVSLSSQIQKPLILSIGTPRLGLEEFDGRRKLRQYNGFALKIIAGQYWEEWGVSKLLTDPFSFDNYLIDHAKESLPDFIQEHLGVMPNSFQEAVEMDNVYYQGKYSREHPRYVLGRYADAFLEKRNNDNYFASIYDHRMACDSCRSIYDKVSSHRF